MLIDVNGLFIEKGFPAERYFNHNVIDQFRRDCPNPNSLTIYRNLKR